MYQKFDSLRNRLEAQEKKSSGPEEHSLQETVGSKTKRGRLVIKRTAIVTRESEEIV